MFSPVFIFGATDPTGSLKIKFLRKTSLITARESSERRGKDEADCRSRVILTERLELGKLVPRTINSNLIQCYRQER